MDARLQPRAIEQGSFCAGYRGDDVAVAHGFLRAGGCSHGNTQTSRHDAAKGGEFVLVAGENLDFRDGPDPANRLNLPYRLSSAPEYAHDFGIGAGQMLSCNAAGGTGTHHAQVARFQNAIEMTIGGVIDVHQKAHDTLANRINLVADGLVARNVAL